MSDSINFATAAQTIAFRQSANAQVSGMTMAEAASALRAQTASNGMHLVGFEAQVGNGATLNFPTAESATEAFESFEASGGLTSGANAALTGSGSIGAGTVALASSQAVPTGVVGVATGSAGLIAAGAAPVFGAALGYGLYEAAPDFWTQISQALIPWAWEEGGIMHDIFPLIFDGDGNTYVSQEMLEALAEVLIVDGDSQAEYAGQNQDALLISPVLLPHKGDVYYLGQTIGATSGYKYSFDTPVYAFLSPITPTDTSSYTSLFISDVPFLYGKAWGAFSSALPSPTTQPSTGVTAGGVTFYYLIATNQREHYPSSNSDEVALQNVAWRDLLTNQAAKIATAVGTVVYDGTIVTPGGLPEQVTQWQGQPYPANPNTIDVLTGFDEQGNPQYETYQQVALPIGDPLVTNDPLVQPDPYYNPSPEVDPQTGAKVYPAIDPYINPTADPSQYPDAEEIPLPDKEKRTAPLPSIENVPQTEPVPSPETDPSADPTTEPTPIPEPVPAPSSGNSNFPSLPLLPLFPDGNAGLFHVYNPTNAQLQAFGSWLWTTFSGNLIDTLSKLFNNPMDAVISLQEFYGTPNIQGFGTIRCGYLDSEISSMLVGIRYNSINCGTIVIPEYYGNYLDYAPYTQVIIYLPFVGFMSLNADDIIGNAVQVVYNVDSYTGSVIAIITVARSGYQSVVYQFEGNCSVDVPVTGGQQSSIKGAIIGGISGAVAGGVAGAAVGAVLGGLSTKNDVQHSGSFSSSYGAMGAKKPFIVVRRPVQKLVYNYSESYGYPAHKMVYVGNCRGYLRAREVRVLSTTATNEEKAMIVNALKQGVYVKN